MEDYPPAVYNFFTVHRAIFESPKAVDTLWVDEFTLYDWNALVECVERTKPRRIVGDTKRSSPARARD